ncbi:MAG: hypothetical protein EZS28_051223, partial [Streblomastix strix]
PPPPPSLDTNGTRQQNGKPSSSKLHTLYGQKLSTQDGGNTLQGGSYFQGGIAERVSDHIMLNSKRLQDGTNIEKSQQKRSQVKLSSYEMMIFDFETTKHPRVVCIYIVNVRRQQLAA